MYKHPGVYIEEIPSGMIAIEAASTSIAAILGPVPRGELNEPVFLSNTGQFASKFGPAGDTSGGIRDYNDTPDLMGFAVNAFFTNGGTKAYVVRVDKGDGKKAECALSNPTDAGKGLYFEANSVGGWGNDLSVVMHTVIDGNSDPSLGYVVSIGTGTGDDFEALETFSGVSLDENDGRFLPAVVNTGSGLVSVKVKPITTGGGGNLGALMSAPLTGLDFTSLVGKTLKLKVNGGSEFDISFTSAENTLKAVAEKIETDTRDGNSASTGRGGFTALVTSDSRLILISGTKGGSPSVSAEGGPASGLLGLADGEGTVLEYPASGEAIFLKGTDSNAPGPAEYKAAFQELKNYRDVSIILMPGEVWPGDGTRNTSIDEGIAHCEFMKNRMIIVDPPNPKRQADSALTSPKQVVDHAFPTSTTCALYYPWLSVANPNYNPETAANKQPTFDVPPSAYAAGLWARIDSSRGVWKSPAGLEATVRGMQGPTLLIGNDIQDNLNEWGVNCVRPIMGPSVIWGARTLATKAKPEHRYVSVRRTTMMIGESLYGALQAVVFEPNDYRLWSALRGSIGNFMDGLHRAGAFQGEKASDAYYVRCGLDSTMTQGDIDAGIVRAVVGFAPLKPAEFVVVQIQQIVGQSKG